MHYFVTGATGFLGGYVTATLLARGHGVTALVPTAEAAFAMADHGVWAQVGRVTDPASLRRGMLEADGVFHVAGHRIGFAHRKTAEAVNVEGTRKVLEVARSLGVPKVVYTSTLGVLGDTGGEVVDEAHPLARKPVTEYDRIKARVLSEVVRPMADEGLPVVTVLAGAVYGPGDTSRMAAVIERFLRGKVAAATEGAAYCWAHAEDSALAHLLAMERGEPGGTYIIGGDPHTVRDVLARVGRIVGKPHPPAPAPGWAAAVPAAVVGTAATVAPPLRPLADRLRLARGVTYLGSDAKARRELGWVPRTVDEGLPDAVEWLLREMLEPA